MQDLEVVFDPLPSDALTRLVVDGVELISQRRRFCRMIALLAR
jgi:hypothetical protein